LWTAAIATAVSGFSAPDIGRAAISDDTSLPAATVRAVSLSRSSGLAELEIAVSGQFEVDDFSLQAPHRIVVDLQPATLATVPALYDGIVRGGIRNVRVSQYQATVVRIVLDLDKQREYDVSRDEGVVRVSLPTSEEFEPWNAAARPQGAALKSAPPVIPPSDVRDVTPPSVTRDIGPPVATALTQPPVVPVAFKPQQTGGRISLSVRDTDLRDVLAIFAERSGRSIITSITDVKVTAEITDQPWQIALTKLLETYGLTAVDDPVSRIISVRRAAEVQALKAFEPVVSTRLPLNYANAADLAATLTQLLDPDCGQSVAPPTVGGAGASGMGAGTGGAGASAGSVAAGAQMNNGAGGQSAGAAASNGQTAQQTQPQTLQQLTSPTCVARGRVIPEPTTNTLIIYETASRIDSIVNYARSFDQRPKQVNIKAQIISINRTNTSQLGVSYDLGSPNTFFNTLAPRTTSGPQTEFQVTLGGDAFAGVANADRRFAADAAINLLYNTTIGGFSLSSFLDALAQEELSDIQAVPSVNTVDRKPAELFVGSTISFLLTPPTAAGAIQAAVPQIATLDVGIRLNVVPAISANRTIRLSISAVQSSLLSITVAGPNISNRNVTNEVIVQDGETAVITGLTQKQISKTRRGIPMLMNLPLLGRLFAENESIETTDDLLILITAHILDDPVPAPVRR
jgi:type II secretory pathway component GspD/PulD (secretin)